MFYLRNMQVGCLFSHFVMFFLWNLQPMHLKHYCKVSQLMKTWSGSVTRYICKNVKRKSSQNGTTLKLSANDHISVETLVSTDQYYFAENTTLWCENQKQYFLNVNTEYQANKWNTSCYMPSLNVTVSQIKRHSAV